MSFDKAKYKKHLASWKSHYKQIAVAMALAGKEFAIPKRIAADFFEARDEEDYELCKAMIDAYIWWKKQKFELPDSEEELQQIANDSEVIIRKANNLEEAFFDASIETLGNFVDGLTTINDTLKELSRIMQQFDEKR